MKWTVLGCHSPYPAAGGATPGYLLEAEGKRILIDCGSGVLSRLAEFFPIYQLDAVILSHLHHDHISDLFVLQYAVMTSIKLKQRDIPLTVWAPEKPIEWFAKLTYQQFVTAQPVYEDMTVTFGKNLRIQFFRTDHGVPCFAMRIQDGNNTILYGADSGPKTDWQRMAKAPDLFVCEATYLHRDLPAEPTGHLSARQAGEAARSIRAKRLLVTHLYPEYDPASVLEEAKGVFGGETLLARSGLSVEL